MVTGIFTPRSIGLIALAGVALMVSVACDSPAKKLTHEARRLRKDGEDAAAMAKLQEALELDPEYAKAHERLASLHKKQGDYDKAIEHYEKAFAIDPDQVDLHQKIVRAYINKGRPADLRKAVERADIALKDRLVLRDPDLTDQLNEEKRRAQTMLAEAEAAQAAKPARPVDNSPAAPARPEDDGG